MGLLYSLFGKLLFFLYTLVGNYGFAIILFTILVKSLLLPLNIKSTKSMRETQALAPVIKEIQKKYRNNPEKLNQETTKLYKIYNVNPMGGCLPLLIQLPIIYALYGALRNPAQYVFTGMNLDQVNQSFFWIKNLSESDPYYILPILCVVFTFLTQKFTMSVNPQNDEGPGAGTQQTMLYVMPLMIGFFALRMPAGISLYWVVQNIYTFIQQVIMLRKKPKLISVAEAEERIKEYDLEQERERRKQIKVRREYAEQRMNPNAPKKKKSGKKSASIKMTPAGNKKVRRTITKIPQRKD